MIGVLVASQFQTAPAVHRCIHGSYLRTRRTPKIMRGMSHSPLWRGKQRGKLNLLKICDYNVKHGNKIIGVCQLRNVFTLTRYVISIARAPHSFDVEPE